MFLIKKVFIIEEEKKIEYQYSHPISSFGVTYNAVSMREKMTATQRIIALEI